MFPKRKRNSSGCGNESQSAVQVTSMTWARDNKTNSMVHAVAGSGLLLHQSTFFIMVLPPLKTVLVVTDSYPCRFQP